MTLSVIEIGPMTNSSQAGQGAVSNILAVAGFIILIAIIIWGAYHFLELASSGLSSLFGRNSDAIKVTLSDDSVVSGEAFDASWDYAPEGAGVFTVLYQCQEGLQLRSVTTAGVVTPIPCGAAYPLGNESTKSTRIIPSISGSEAIESAFTVIFNPVVDPTSTSTAAAPRPQGSATVTIAPPTTVVETPTPTNTKQPVTTTKPTTKPVTTTPSTSSGTPDLEIRIIAVGVIDAYTGSFVSRNPISPEETVAVKFDVTNRGTGTSGSWYFSAELPTYPLTPYNSPKQAPLAPGAHIESTLRFNHVAVGGGRFAVSADSSNAVSESNEKNNDAAIWVSGPTTGYQYGY